MAMVRAACPACRVHAVLRPVECRMFRCTSHRGRDFLAFVCPDCNEPTTVPVNDVEVGILAGYGVVSRMFTLPAEILDVKRRSEPWSVYDEFDLRHDLETLDSECAG